MKKRIMIVGILAIAMAAVGLVGFKAYSTVKAAAVQPLEVQSILTHGIGGSGQGLADALGVTLEELTTAKENAYKAGIDEALAQGLITQAQADALKARTSGFPFGRGWDGWLTSNGIDFNSLLADQLNITVDELNTARAKAADAAIDQAVTDGRITQEQADLMKGENTLSGNESFLSAMKTAFTNAVNQAVQSGVITQAQADALLNNLNTNGFNYFGGRGRHNGFEGGRRGRPGFFLPGSDLSVPQLTPPTGTQSTPGTGL